MIFGDYGGNRLSFFCPLIARSFSAWQKAPGDSANVTHAAAERLTGALTTISKESAVGFPLDSAEFLKTPP